MFFKPGCGKKKCFFNLNGIRDSRGVLIILSNMWDEAFSKDGKNLHLSYLAEFWYASNSDRSVVFIVIFEHVSHLVLVFLLLTLNM